MSHSLLDKLATLESLFRRANDRASLEELNLLLRCLEGIVTCKHCHRDYFDSAPQACLQWRIDRVQAEALKSFSILERELGRELPKQRNLARYLKSVSKSAVSEAKALGLKSDSKILFIGCGARPVSCHALSAFFGCQVLGIDVDPDCVEAANHYAEQLAQSSRLNFALGDGAQFAAAGFSHVVVASLVENKRAVLECLSRELSEGAKVALRFGDGLYRLMNYPKPEIDQESWESLGVDLNPKGFYQTLYLKRKSP